MSFGRKFWGCIVGLILLTVIMLILIFTKNTALTETVVLLYMGLVVLLVITYIGGNVFIRWIDALKEIKPSVKIGK